MNYLIFRNDGIGDLIAITNILESIKSNKNNKIYLICSKRNIQYADELRKSELIDKVINYDDHVKNFVNLISFIYLIRKLKVDKAIIYKLSTKNILISLFSAKYIYSILPLQKRDRNRSKYKLPFFLSKLIFNDFEVIDETNNFNNSKHIHMKDHFLNLFKKIPSNLNLITTRYPQPTSLTEKISQTKILLNSIFYKKRIILFHIDEKWDESNLTGLQIYELIKTISNICKDKYFLIITFGYKETLINKIISDSLSLEKIENINTNLKIEKSKNIRNVCLIRKTNLNELVSIIANCSLVIESHSSLTHISSVYNIPVIDIIKNGRENFYNKWKPTCDRFIQIQYKELKKIDEIVNKFT